MAKKVTVKETPKKTATPPKRKSVEKKDKFCTARVKKATIYVIGARFYIGDGKTAMDAVSVITKLSKGDARAFRKALRASGRVKDAAAHRRKGEDR